MHKRVVVELTLDARDEPLSFFESMFMAMIAGCMSAKAYQETRVHLDDRGVVKGDEVLPCDPCGFNKHGPYWMRIDSAGRAYLARHA